MKNSLRLPGLIDAHVHLRDPGATQKEDFQTGTTAAIAGGFTTVIDMPNNLKPTTTLMALKEKIKMAQKKALCQVYFYFGADQKNFSEYKKVKGLAKGLKIYLDHTTGPLFVEDLNVLINHFKFWPKKLPILVHAEGANILKAIQLSKIYKKKLHLCHISQASELEIIKWAKIKGMEITCEVTPHHLFLTQDDEKRLGPFIQMRPSLRSKKDQKAIWKGLKSGLIDIIASDHAPHTINEKKSKNPPSGIPGLETTLPLLLTAINEKRLTLAQFKRLLFENPRKIFKINQPPNTYIEIDLKEKWIIQNRQLYTKCGWSPFNGFKVQGKLKKVIFNGKKVFQDGKILVKR